MRRKRIYSKFKIVRTMVQKVKPGIPQIRIINRTTRAYSQGRRERIEMMRHYQFYTYIFLAIVALMIVSFAVCYMIPGFAGFYSYITEVSFIGVGLAAIALGFVGLRSIHHHGF